ncbi:hypothetical protein MHBO_002642 [Bonamia ostreae]|uniref:Kringle domain-containing protein n=1 Tax=Bonamia ostreae TaxID=126728 RepID=A0ABV2ANL5_9EUKA
MLDFLNIDFSRIETTSPPVSEKCTGIGLDYRGNLASSVSGKQCLQWSSFYKNLYKEAGIGEHNYCRNPLFDTNGVFCIVEYNGDQDIVEHCDKKCTSGFLVEKHNFFCDKFEVLLEYGPFTDCQERCLSNPDCKYFIYKDNDNNCLRCLALDSSNEIKGGYNYGGEMYKKYGEESNIYCKLRMKDLESASIDTTFCRSSNRNGLVNVFDCNVKCNQNYVGNVNILCNNSEDYFVVDDQCKRLLFDHKKLCLKLFFFAHLKQKNCYIITNNVALYAINKNCHAILNKRVATSRPRKRKKTTSIWKTAKRRRQI